MIYSDNNLSNTLFSPIAIAPMIDWTYMHFRVLMRILAPKALLYTEMQTTGAIEHNTTKALEFFHTEHPIALQLGGANPEALVKSALKAEACGFSEINLNLGCPSDRVQAGRFGACLMAEPKLVATCIQAIKSAVSIPVSAKTRIGIDENDSYSFFAEFVHTLIHAGCDKIIVHARKAWLNGLSPKQNRTIPPLHYDYVYRIKQEILPIPIVLNGNVQTSQEVETHLQHVDGVMLGRLACQNPYKIAQIHHMLYPDIPLRSRTAILTDYIHYLLTYVQSHKSISALIKPILNLAHALPNSKIWREKLVSVYQSGSLSLLEDSVAVLLELENRVVLD